jgi:hypothetical protein
MFSPGAATMIESPHLFCGSHAKSMPALFPWSNPAAVFRSFSAGKSPVAFVFYLADNLTDW